MLALVTTVTDRVARTSSARIPDEFPRSEIRILARLCFLSQPTDRPGLMIRWISRLHDCQPQSKLRVGPRSGVRNKTATSKLGRAQIINCDSLRQQTADDSFSETTAPKARSPRFNLNFHNFTKQKLFHSDTESGEKYSRSLLRF